MSDSTKFALSLIPLFLIPFIVGRAALWRRVPLPSRWWFGVVSIGLFFTIGHALNVGLNTLLIVLGVAIVAGTVCLLVIRDWRQKRPQIPHWSELCVILLLLPLLGAAYIQVFRYPLYPPWHWDGIVIWYQKAKAVYYGTPFVELPPTPYITYPNLGPMYWMFVMKFTGGAWEAYGRLLFPTLYFFWALSLRGLCTPKMPLLPVIMVPLLGWIFFDRFSFISGYQDGFVMLVAGMAAIHLCKLLVDHEDKREMGGILFDRADLFLACFFSGSAAFVKVEGSAMGIILIGSGLLILFVSKYHCLSIRLVIKVLPNLFLFLVMLSLWPLLLIYNHIDLTTFNNNVFTLDGVLHFYKNIGRWSTIKVYLGKYFIDNSGIMIPALLSCVGALVFVPRIRKALIFLWLVWLGHLLFIVMPYFVTKASLELHISTSFSRLTFQHSFIYATVLMLSISFLAEAAIAREKGVL